MLRSRPRMPASQRSSGSISKRGSAAPRTDLATDAKRSSSDFPINLDSRNQASRGEATFHVVPTCLSGASGNPVKAVHCESNSSNLPPASCSKANRSPSRLLSQAPAKSAGMSMRACCSSAQCGFLTDSAGIKRRRTARLRTESRVKSDRFDFRNTHSRKSRLKIFVGCSG